MNFLSHYFVDRVNPDDMFTVGAATPDLLSIYDPKHRVKSGHLKRLPKETRALVDPGLIAGLEAHFFVDAVFHSSDYFLEETQFISAMLIEFFPERDIPRKYFLAHILLELMIDKVLIEDHPGILESYYAHFELLSPFHRVRTDTERIIGFQMDNYEGFLLKFVKNKYLYDYKNFSHLIYVIGRILRRVNISEDGFLSDDRFLKLMQRYEARLRDIYLLFFEEIKAARKKA